jgi:Helicase HerA, central domain
LTGIRVPLAVDAQVRVPFGPILLPLRALALMVASAPVALVCLGIGALSVSSRVGLAVSVLMLGFTLAAPTRDGIWIGTWYLYRLARRFVPTAVLDGHGWRARVHFVGDGLEVSRVRAEIAPPSPLRALRHLTSLPTVESADAGIIRLNPGGARAVLMVEGPSGAPGGDQHAQWCSVLVRWLLSLECPAQLVSMVSNFDSRRAQTAFDERTKGYPPTRLVELERDLAGLVAEQSLGLRHFVVLSPGLAPADGIPWLSRATRLPRAVEATDGDAARVLQSALRAAPGVGIAATVPDRDDLADLLVDTIVGTMTAAASTGGVVRISDQFQIVLTATRLPATVAPGAVVDALIRSRVRGIASMHILPVEARVARKALDRRAAMQRYTAREGNDAIDNQVALADTTAALAAIAQRQLVPCRIALSFAVQDSVLATAASAAERLDGLLRGQGFEVTQVTSPGFLAAMSVAPGGAPLGRSLQLTSDTVASCLVPSLGTPFADQHHPLVGISQLTGSPVYLSIWSRPNHNAVVLGSSGSGKSVAAKTLLVRHLMEGASAVVIDPDSEYRRVMNAVGGLHFELGTDALNPLAPGIDVAPDIAAGLVLPVLSVMAGDEKGIKDGRPIRRLPDEDQGWIHGEIAAFYHAWAHRPGGHEPLMHDLVEYIGTQSVTRALTHREKDRCRIITARLRRFTQGDRARIFDRPSTFRVGERPVSVGLREFALTYAADLTPALAVVLTAVLAALGRDHGRLIVVVDEAHRVTIDPDAGEVLGQLVRQARKHGAGVWMCSQQVQDFVETDLGRTLVATAATKIILGVEEAALSDVRDVFGLRDEEVVAINPAVQGRAVVLSGAERTVVAIVPGPALLALGGSTPAPRRHPAPAPAG